MDSSEKLKLALQTALDKKAEDPVVIDLRGLTSIADYFLIVTASSDTHARTIAEEIKRKLKEQGVQPVSVEGLDNASWILLDYGDLIVHVFRPETRELYSIESLWMDAPHIKPEELLPQQQ
ncbi:ribosome silencing factor [Thermovibrio ammonificans]|uniref:Ribosomal silencing factor RsfS n=1 Tax=Thermovibrio ammonificans (strain DSM 15698 / JCM 12110 / HB-1) TaxID=648996 RepID=E8T3G4_THEA1|nr:ribosome silencing factor [Thermovibrio ammonificans]ADU96095.1 iojap-like protein [Thermovibrio ammonificans HB-1]